MELSKFSIGKNFTTLKKNLIDYGLKIKELDNLFLIYHSDKIQDNAITRECNGIIMDKNNFKIVCYTMNKCYTDILSLNMLDKINVCHTVEGTLLRVYYYNNKWNYSTKRCIDSKESYWLSNKNFYELFYDCIDGYNLEEILNKDYCYSFIIIHPENKMVIHYKNKCLYHIKTYCIHSSNIINNHYLNVPNILYTEKNVLEGYNTIEFVNKREKDTILYEGLLFTDTQNKMCKIKNTKYIKLKELWGNTNNRFLRYLELRKDIQLLKSYLNYFKNEKELFIDFEDRINKYSYVVLSTYVKKYITKENVLIPYYMKKLIYILHGDFIKTRIKTDFGKIMMKLLEMTSHFVYFMITHHEKIEESINKIGYTIVVTNYDTKYLDFDFKIENNLNQNHPDIIPHIPQHINESLHSNPDILHSPTSEPIDILYTPHTPTYPHPDIIYSTNSISS